MTQYDDRDWRATFYVRLPDTVDPRGAQGK
jgi:hypothetical protein